MSDTWFAQPGVRCLQDNELCTAKDALEHLKASLKAPAGSRAVDAQIFCVQDPGCGASLREAWGREVIALPNHGSPKRASHPRAGIQGQLTLRIL